VKRPLFVFAGQSNMMGAASLEAKQRFSFQNSFEYLHKPKRFGASIGQFKKEAFPAGEFSYKNLKEAYENETDFAVKSTLTDYTANTFFCPAMSNVIDESRKIELGFQDFSEATAKSGPCLAPYFAKELEDAGYACAYTHIAKGSIGINYYLEGDAADYFSEKVCNFFSDSKQFFPEDDIDEKVFVWHQGESDSTSSYHDYLNSLKQLTKKTKEIGFTKFFICRVGYWGNEKIVNIMRAQEDFCRQEKEAFMITRAASFFEYPNQEIDNWFSASIEEEYQFCRDSFFGYQNNHINEKGFQILAKHAAPNAIRILFEGKKPILEKEIIIPLQSFA